MKKVVGLIVVTMLLATISLSGCTDTFRIGSEMVYDQTSSQTIPENSMWYLRLEFTETASVEYKLTSDKNVDLVLMQDSDFQNYKSAINSGQSFFGYSYIPDGSKENTREVTRTLNIPKGTFYVVVDNTEFIGTEPNGPARVTIKLDAYYP